MSHDLTEVQKEATSALGLFVLAWSTLEGTLEVAISKLLGLSPLDGSSVTAGLQFKAKSTLLQSLLKRDCAKYVEAIKTAKLVRSTERNDLLHGLAGRNESGLVFTRRTNYGAFCSEEKEFSPERLLRLAVEISQLARRLQLDLGISEEDYLDFFLTAHREQAKS